MQNTLLQLKKHIILTQEHSVFRGLLGLDGKAQVARAWQAVEPSLPPAEKLYGASFFKEHPEGLFAAGKLEAYLNGFFHTLDAAMQQKLERLLQFEKVEEQWRYFLKELHKSHFREQFITYFDEQNLSKGRDPQLFRYAGESGGESFYLRLMQQLYQVSVKDNFFFRFLFFGFEQLPERILPPCYQAKHYLSLRRQLHKLEIKEGEAIDYLLSREGASINKASLSNIFEYASREEFASVCRQLFTSSSRRLRLVFWNLLQDQGINSPYESSAISARAEELSASEACFYFRNVRVLETVPVPVEP